MIYKNIIEINPQTLILNLALDNAKKKKTPATKERKNFPN